MTTVIVLIAAILVLGGVIATVGDRLGTRVGKARLSLFNLRPRKTATVITILTGSVISASTFALLFGLSEQLRRGVFDYEEIQGNLTTARQQLDRVKTERNQSQKELRQAVSEQNAAERRLRQINRSLRRAIAEQEQTEVQLGSTQSQLNRTQNQLKQIGTNFRQAQALLRTVSQQAAALRTEIQQLQVDRQRQLAQRDREIIERNQAIAERDQAIAERETQLRELENQRSFLAQEVETLYREFQGLRQGNVALLRNQPLASGVVRIVNPNAAPQAVDQLLRQANQEAVQRLRPGTTNVDEQVLQVTTEQVQQLTSQIEDGQDYVVRVLSAGNYIVGEPCVLAGEPCIQVFIAAAPNQIVFAAGEVVAATSVDPTTMNNEKLIDRINLLIAASQFRARQAGILSDAIQIADGRAETVVSFFDRVKQYTQPVDVQAIAAEVTYTAGPVRLELVAVQNGQILFTTRPQ